MHTHKVENKEMMQIQITEITVPFYGVWKQHILIVTYKEFHILNKE